MELLLSNTKRCMIFQILIWKTYFTIETAQIKADFFTVFFFKSWAGLQRVKLPIGRGDTAKVKYVIN